MSFSWQEVIRCWVSSGGTPRKFGSSIRGELPDYCHPLIHCILQNLYILTQCRYYTAIWEQDQSRLPANGMNMMMGEPWNGGSLVPTRRYIYKVMTESFVAACGQPFGRTPLAAIVGLTRDTLQFTPPAFITILMMSSQL